MCPAGGIFRWLRKSHAATAAPSSWRTMPNPPGLRRRFGERAGVIEMFFTPVSALGSAPEFFLTDASITGAPARHRKRGTSPLIITGLFADAGKRDASKR